MLLLGNNFCVFFFFLSHNWDADCLSDYFYFSLSSHNLLCHWESVFLFCFFRFLFFRVKASQPAKPDGMFPNRSVHSSTKGKRVRRKHLARQRLKANLEHEWMDLSQTHSRTSQSDLLLLNSAMARRPSVFHDEEMTDGRSPYIFTHILCSLNRH